MSDTTTPQPQKEPVKIDLDPKASEGLVEALRKIADYLAEEEKHFEACDPAEQEFHIWKEVVRLQKFLNEVDKQIEAIVTLEGNKS